MAEPTRLLDPGAIMPALLFAAAAVVLFAGVCRPMPRMAVRLRPYASANRVRLGRPADVATPRRSGSAVTAACVSVLASAVNTFNRLVDREGDDALATRLRHAGSYPHLGTSERLLAYRKRRLGITAAAAGIACLPALALGSGRLVPVTLALGVLFGVSWPRGQLDAAIRARRDRMTIDLYTVCQHLAMLLRTGASAAEALGRLVERGRGPVVAELADALVWARAGTPLPEALRSLAERTAEPWAGRAYRTLAKAADGGDVTDALLGLADGVRDSRRDALQRLAIRRRATMIIPIVFLLVPPLLILVGAPLPAQLFGQLP